MKKIAVIIPCHNEESTVGRVVTDFQGALPGADIYVYDNCSNDRTAEAARQAGAIVISEPRKGKGRVVRRAFRDVEADVYVMVDGDDTYPATNAEEMVGPVVSGEVDMVVGDRLSSTYFTENKRPLHNSGNRFIRWLINRMFRSRIHDVLTGYRVFSREFVKSIPVQSRGFEIETELTAHALNFDYRIKEVVVPYRDRPAESHSKLNTLGDGWRIIKTAFSLFRDYRPMLFFTTISALVALIAVGMLVPVFAAYFRTGLVERFPTLIFGCFLLLAAVMLGCSGLILQVLTNQNRKLLDSIRLKMKT